MLSNTRGQSLKYKIELPRKAISMLLSVAGGVIILYVASLVSIFGSITALASVKRWRDIFQKCLFNV
jgi:hypothetical protein